MLHFESRRLVKGHFCRRTAARKLPGIRALHSTLDAEMLTLPQHDYVPAR